MVPSQEIEGFTDLQLNIEARLDKTVMTLRDLLNLAPNSTIKLSRPAGENIDVFIGDTLVCSGEIVVLNETIGVRITDFREEA